MITAHKMQLQPLYLLEINLKTRYRWKQKIENW